MSAYRALFDEGKGLGDGPGDFAKGVRLTLQAFLQSPYFVYRVETSSDVGRDGLIMLSGYEIATRLSYMIWNTMPDDALFAAAASGALSTAEGVRAETERLLADDRARGARGARARAGRRARRAGRAGPGRGARVARARARAAASLRGRAAGAAARIAPAPGGADERRVALGSAGGHRRTQRSERKQAEEVDAARRAHGHLERLEGRD